MYGLHLQMKCRDLFPHLKDLVVLIAPAPTECSCSSLSHTHRSMVFFRNQTFALATGDSARPIDYSVPDSRVVFAPARKNLSSINLVSIFGCSSFPRNPVYERRVDFSALALVFHHTDSYISLLFSSRFID
jgi:hypothetical protein